jgi:glutamate/tyrosine decarboxylase-like PLP-dependent enzyme
VVSASSIFAGTWLEAAGSTYAENQALAWLAGLAGMPNDTGGVFVSGGTAGNLSGLVAARHAAIERRGGRPDRWRLLASAEAHSSIGTAGRVMDVDLVTVPADERGRMTGESLRSTIANLPEDERRSLFAVVANAGATNSGAVDDLTAVAEVARAYDLWMHVDGAWRRRAGRALISRPLRWHRARGFARDRPHKWLFALYDCAALLYARPRGPSRRTPQLGG